MRQARIKVAGLPWHIVHRGHNRDACFFAPPDYGFYLNQLKRLSSLHGCTVHAYALMTNHVHLLVTPVGEAAVSYSDLLDVPIPEPELAFLRHRSRAGFVIGSPSFEREIGEVAGRAVEPLRSPRRRSEFSN